MNQDVLSKSYADSLNSYLSQHQDDPLNDHDRYARRPSIQSNLSNMIGISRTPSMTNYYQTMTGGGPSSTVPYSNNMVKKGSMNEILPENAILSRTNTVTTAASIPYEDDGDSYNNYDPEATTTPYDDDDEPTPLPKMQMFIICIILFSEPMTSTILLPFIYFMVFFLFIYIFGFSLQQKHVFRCFDNDINMTPFFLGSFLYL